jgi:hypothetical protein
MATWPPFTSTNEDSSSSATTPSGRGKLPQAVHRPLPAASPVPRGGTLTARSVVNRLPNESGRRSRGSCAARRTEVGIRDGRRHHQHARNPALLMPWLAGNRPTSFGRVGCCIDNDRGVSHERRGIAASPRAVPG